MATSDIVALHAASLSGVGVLLFWRRIFHFQVFRKKWMTGPDKEMDVDSDRTVSSLDT